MSALSLLSFFFFFNELERREKGTPAAGAKIRVVAKTSKPVANSGQVVAALASGINDLRADTPEIHGSCALLARSLWKNPPMRPRSDRCAHWRTHLKPESRAATRPEEMREGVRPHDGRIG
jgi:hypothetical protein